MSLTPMPFITWLSLQFCDSSLGAYFYHTNIVSCLEFCLEVVEPSVNKQMKKKYCIRGMFHLLSHISIFHTKKKLVSEDEKVAHASSIGEKLASSQDKLA